MIGTDTWASSLRAAPPSAGTQRLRLQHRGMGQVAQHPCRAHHRRRSLRWPAGYGFQYFYGFLGGEASQYEPQLVRNTAYVEHPRTSGGHDYYHLSEDLADDAISWLREHKAFAPDKPFFMYWAPGASHGPHQVPKEWSDKYKGKFDDGWDKYRERAFRRAKQMGWIPPDAQLTPRPATLASWDSIPDDEKPFQRRLMEVFAGFTEHVDTQIGRMVDEIDRLGYGDNTLVLYIWGDNGASTEGQDGSISELLAQNGIPTTTKQQIAALNALGGLDVLGTLKTDNMYHAGWAWAGSTPYQATKLIASHFGGTRNPLAIRWPAKIKPDATPRAQFLHVNDVVSTIYDILGIKPPRVVNGDKSRSKDVFRRHQSQPVDRVVQLINPILRGWVNYFAVGHSSECFSFIKDWVEKKVRRCALGNERASAGRDGVGSGCTKPCDCSMVTGLADRCRKSPRQDRSHKPWGEANRRAQCGKSACCVRRGGGWKRGMVEML